MAFWINIKRVARYGLVGFIRNAFTSLAAVLIMTITLSVVAALLISSAALNAVLVSLTNQVQVSVYFSPTATLSQIMQIQQGLTALPQVATTTYISREEALENFKMRHEGDQLTMQALEELGENPLGASLEVRAKETSQYETIAKYLESQSSSAGSMIEKVNYQQNEMAIKRLTNIIDTSHRLGAVIGIVLAIASVLITFNTIRLVIYTARDEIGVMNIVGAGRWYVRGPFLVGGVLCGVISSVIVLLLLYPITLSLGESSQTFFGTFNVYTYFIEHVVFFILSIFGCGILLGASSSYLAVRRYLKV